MLRRRIRTTQGTPPLRRWLVVAAFPPELAHLDAALPRLAPAIRRRVTTATVGIGLVEAAAGTSALLAKTKPDALVLIGTAGVYPAWSSELSIGQAVVANRIALLPEILAKGDTYLPAAVPREAKVDPALAKLLRQGAGLATADVACPLAITQGSRAAKSAGKLSGCALENLEAFAVARAAARAKVPFAAVLGIANVVGPDGHREWMRHSEAAAASACDAILVLLGSRPSGDRAETLRRPLDGAARGQQTRRGRARE